MSHYYRPWGGHVEWGLHPHYSLKNMSRCERVVADKVMKELGMRKSVNSNQWTLSVGTCPTQSFPYHHPWLLSLGPMWYEKIPTPTCDGNWRGPRSFKSWRVWLGMVSHGWPGSWLDPHAHHVDQWCILSNAPYPCRKSIFPSFHIVCVVAGCAKPAEYAASVPPKSCCRWGCHPNTPLQNYWWIVTRYLPSSSWKWLENLSNQRAWPTIQKGLPLTWRRSSIHMSVLSGPSVLSPNIGPLPLNWRILD